MGIKAKRENNEKTALGCSQVRGVLLITSKKGAPSISWGEVPVKDTSVYKH